MFAQEDLGTPALAFVRAVCDALRLDSSIEEEVLVLRRNLLLLTHTLEFAPAAEFQVRAHLPALAFLRFFMYFLCLMLPPAVVMHTN